MVHYRAVDATVLRKYQMDRPRIEADFLLLCRLVGVDTAPPSNQTIGALIDLTIQQRLAMVIEDHPERFGMVQKAWLAFLGDAANSPIKRGYYERARQAHNKWCETPVE